MVVNFRTTPIYLVLANAVFATCCAAVCQAENLSNPILEMTDKANMPKSRNPAVDTSPMAQLAQTHKPSDRAKDQSAEDRQAKLWHARALMDRAQQLEDCSNLHYARELSDKAATVVRQCAGPQSYEYAIALGLLGGIDADLYMFDEAHQELEDAKATLYRQTANVNVENLRAIESNLAWVKHRRGDSESAQRKFEGILATKREESLTTKTHDVLIWTCLANLHFDKNELIRGLACMRQADELCKTIPDDPRVTIGVQTGHARYYVVKHDFARANNLFAQALNTARNSDTISFRKYAELLCYYSESLWADGQGELAREILQEKKAEIERCLGPTHPKVLEIRDRLASLPQNETLTEPRGNP